MPMVTRTHCRATTMPDSHPAPKFLIYNGLGGEEPLRVTCPGLAIGNSLERCKNFNANSLSGRPLCLVRFVLLSRFPPCRVEGVPPPASAHVQKVPYGCAHSE